MSKEIKYNDDVMFLFGAGISIPIGIPAMKGIYKTFLDKKKSGISSAVKKTCEFFTKEMEVEHDLEEFLLAANSIIEFQHSNLNRFVEKNISKKISSKKITEYKKNLKGSLKDVINIRKGILEYLSRVCFQFDREKAVKINSGFVDALSKLGYSVYSTNYDYAFEFVALEKNIIINDNFIKSGQRYLWNDKIDYDGASGFKLIKLHGSVTWYMDDNGTIEKIYSNTDINLVGKEVDKIVIVPTRFKDIYAQHFFALYSHFLSSLASSKVIVIAGHSLRDDYLRAGIIERKRKGDFQIIVIDPTYPNEIKKELPPSRLGSVGDIIHIPYKWEEFSDELSSVLLNFPSQKLVENCIKILNKRTYTKNKLKIKGNVGTLYVLTEKELRIDVEAYLNLEEKPSRLRAWLAATYTETEGTIQNTVSANFIEVKYTTYGEGLSGLVDSTEKIKIKIPKYDKWLQAGCKVSLKVALLKAHVKKPANIRGRDIIAVGEKALNYK